MPVIIRELVIRAVVNDNAAAGAGQSAPASAATSGTEREILVKECVEQVLEILEKNKER